MKHGGKNVTKKYQVLRLDVSLFAGLILLAPLCKSIIEHVLFIDFDTQVVSNLY